jgi:hypothetical protein
MKWMAVIALTAFAVTSLTHAQLPTSQPTQPSRLPSIQPSNDPLPSFPGKPTDPRGQRPDSFDRSCEEQLNDAKQLVKNQKERIDLLEYIKKDLEKENTTLKSRVVSLESQIEVLKAQLAAKGK